MTSTTDQHHCKRPGCTGILRSAESIERGTSKRCAKLLADRIEEATQGFKPEQVAKAEALVRSGGIKAHGHGLYVARSSRGDVTYATDGLSCSCPAGAHDRRCYHVLAARMVEILTVAPKPARPLALAA